RLIITDLDGTLFGNEEAVEELKERLHASGGKVGLGIATGRRLDSALAALKEWDVPAPDLMITSVGSEIHYGKKLIYDKEYAQHIGYRWRREALVEAMRGFEGFSPQPDIDQRDFKISYFYDPEKAPPRRELVRRLRAMGLEAQVIYSHGQFTDLLPLRASKGQAVRYLGLKWGLGLERILVAGDSGNDEDMLKTAMFGVVVGNYSRELEKLRGQPNIYFAEKPYAFGILEGAEQFDFFGTPHLLQAAAE
ncbi:HAD family hydrolase, partial [bacterium]|nr:HAD family hydrolase [bacterium]